VSLVPRQPQADEEVIAYYSKKPNLTYQEVAALAARINPRALVAAPLADEHPYIVEKRPLLDDILQRLDDQLDPAVRLTAKSAAEWQPLFDQLGLAFPAALVSPPKNQNVSTDLEVRAEIKLAPKERNTYLALLGVTLRVAGVDIKKRPDAVKKIAKEAVKDGIEFSDRTLEKILAKIPDAVGRRKK